MGYIKEPEGIDFFVDPKPLTPEDRKKISEVIAHYKNTGRKILFRKKGRQRRKQRSTVANIANRVNKK